MRANEVEMKIERLAVEHPDALANIPVSAIDGIDADKAAEIAQAAGFDADTAAKVAPVLTSLWTVFENEDATLVEVNPLVKTGSGDILALDGKVYLDDNADFRHTMHEELREISAEILL